METKPLKFPQDISLAPDAVFGSIIVDFKRHHPISVQLAVVQQQNAKQRKSKRKTDAKIPIKNISFLSIIAYPFKKIIEWL